MSSGTAYAAAGWSVCWALLALWPACGDPSGVGPSSAAPAASTVIARVGRQQIEAATVRRIAEQQGLSPRQALDQAVFDARLAEAAQPTAQTAARTTEVLARALLEDQFRRLEQVPISPAELAEATAQHWVDVARPEGARVVHLVVMLKADAGERLRQRAQAFAEKALEAVSVAAATARREPPLKRPERLVFAAHLAGARDPAEQQFEEIVGALDPGDLKLRVELLPIIAPDGRFIQPGNTHGAGVLKAFANAVRLLSERGDLSPVTETEKGLHVIMLLERTPPRMLSAPERLQQLSQDIVHQRARRAKQELLVELRRRFPADEVTNSEALLGLVALDKL